LPVTCGLFVKSILNDSANGSIHHLINHLIRVSVTLKCLKINLHEAEQYCPYKVKEICGRML
jgi:hypothetical protein